MESADAPEKPWDQQPDEPRLWFKRFSLYLLMGPTRSVAAAYCDEFTRRHPGKTCRPQSATNWRVISSRWNWVRRADAWDKEQITLAGVAIRNKLVALQAQRLDMTAELINQARTVLQNAHLEDADETQARCLDRRDAPARARYGGPPAARICPAPRRRREGAECRDDHGG